MLSTLVDFANLFFAALLVGAMFAVWLIYNPAGLDAATYVAQQQHAIRTLNLPLPVLGGVTILATLCAAALQRGDRTKLSLLLLAAAAFVAAGLITRFLNQPINATVITWSPGTPPDGWTDLRDAWWRWHLLRLAVGLGGLSLVIAAALKRDAAC